jgi:hypothetical protein
LWAIGDRAVLVAFGDRSIATEALPTPSVLAVSGFGS